MSILEIKQGIARLSRKDRCELELYFLRLEHESPERKREVAGKVRDLKAGKSLPIAQVEKMLHTRGQR